jgi:dipeptidyl aminopeptidase/acylaminoacyl peptidase
VTVRRARRGDDESEQLVAAEQDGLVSELTPPGGRYDTVSVDGANGILFFAHRPTGRLWRVEALRMTTGDRWPVASSAEDAFYPSVSPDGTRVAFLRLVAFDDAVLSVASSDGGGASVDVAWDAHRFSPPAWSPDGRRLLFARGDPCQRWGIDVVRASGGSLARLTNQCRFFGTARGDRLRGSPFLDELYGFGGDDRLDGRGGRDRLLGGEGDDLLIGGAGEDDVQAGPGRDRVVAGDANDIVRVTDGSRDRVSCGRGSYDIVYADRRDVVGRDCERVYRM